MLGEGVGGTTTQGVPMLTESQKLLIVVLAEEILRPKAHDADEAAAYPPDLIAKATELGITAINIPEEFDGIAEHRSTVTNALVAEAMAYGDMGLALPLLAPSGVATTLTQFGSDAQQKTYLPEFAGESVPASAVVVSESRPLFDPFTLQTTAVREGEELVLTGVKALVPGAADAELFIVGALLDGQPRLVIVEPGAEGLQVEDDPAMGVRAAKTARLHLEGVRVPASNLLGTTEDHLDAVRRARLAWAAAAVGTGQAAFDHVSEYVQERKAFGEPIGYRQAVAFTVADMAIEIDALRLVVWKAAARLDRGEDASAEIAQARSLTSQYLTQVGSNGVQLLGGHGFVKEYDNERWYRDLRGAGVLEGSLLV